MNALSKIEGALHVLPANVCFQDSQNSITFGEDDHKCTENIFQSTWRDIKYNALSRPDLKRNCFIFH